MGFLSVSIGRLLVSKLEPFCYRYALDMLAQRKLPMVRLGGCPAERNVL
jgi:hypothetical protein